MRCGRAAGVVGELKGPANCLRSEDADGGGAAALGAVSGDDAPKGTARLEMRKPNPRRRKPTNVSCGQMTPSPSLRLMLLLLFRNGGV
jgi:hypothetical protein